MLDVLLSSLILATGPIQPPAMAIPCATQERHVLLLYYTNYCPYSQKVLTYLKGVHKTLPMKNIEKSPQDKAELKKIGGKVQIPCLIIDGKAMYESDDIIKWLSQHLGELPASK